MSHDLHARMLDRAIYCCAYLTSHKLCVTCTNAQSVPSQQIADASHYATQRGLLTTPSEIAAFKAHDRVIITEKYRQDAEARGAWKKNGGWVKAQEEKQEKEKKGGLNSRPHQSSGRQLEDLLEIRSSLREGFHRLVDTEYVGGIFH